MIKYISLPLLAFIFSANNQVVDFNTEVQCFDYDIVINEINYNPSLELGQEDSDYEFIELFNFGQEPVNLNGWYLNISSVHGCYQFGDVTINSNEYLILSRSNDIYPNSVNIGEQNSLSNDSDTITLRNAWYLIVDRVNYNDGHNCSELIDDCWPHDADAGGATLELIDPISDNSSCSNWQASFIVPGGTPGELNSQNDGQIYGCTDQVACNYNENATVDNGSCEFSSNNYDCNGDCLIELDCLGECGGTAVVDECGVCNGDGAVFECGCSDISDNSCDCSGNTLDCLGECGGTAVVDECGVCNGDGIGNNSCDCSGNTLDCLGECGGTAVVDECGVCNGSTFDVNICPLPGYKISLLNFDIQNKSLDVKFNNELPIAGFQFDLVGLSIIDIELLSLDGSSFNVYSSDSTVIGFSLNGESIYPSNSDVIRLFFDENYSSEVCLLNPIFSSPSGESIDVEVSDCLDLDGCTDQIACNYGDFNYSCDDCCNYGEMYWLDTDGDGLGYAVDDLMFCSDPGFPWVSNHGDLYPNCFSNLVDSCGECDGDNSSCSGCLDENAFNFNCLNGNWPDTATYGCSDNVLVADDSCLFPPEEFEFNQSTKQAFYKINEANIGDNNLEYMESWVGAFKNGECVGSWPWVGEFTCVPVMGDDGEPYSAGYMNEGDQPSFFIYDSSNEETYEAIVSNNFEWMDLEIYHIDSLSVDIDCNGLTGGNSELDECGICGGDGFIDSCLGTNDCNDMDCFGVCGGEDFCEDLSLNNWSDYGFFNGDINADFRADVTDLMKQISFIVESSYPNQYEFWASDMNYDSFLNVVDVVELSNGILGSNLRSNIYAEANITRNQLETSGSVGAIEFTGILTSELLGQDEIITNSDKNLIFNLSGVLETNLFSFKDKPENILIASVDGILVSVKSSKSSIELSAYPNPFNPSTNINFFLPESGVADLKIYDLNGRIIKSLGADSYQAGVNQVVLNGEDLSAGIYFVSIEMQNYSGSYKIMLLK